MSLKTASFQATYSTGLITPANTKTDESTTSGVYKVTVQKGATTSNVGIYTWDFDVIDDTYGTVVTQIAASTIVNMQLLFKHNLSVDGLSIDILKYTGGDPVTQTGSQIASKITSVLLSSVNIDSTQKTPVTTQLADDYSFYDDTLEEIVLRANVSIALQRSSEFDTSTGSVEIGGLNLIGGSSEWRVNSGTEITDPPLLVITYEVTEESHPALNMKFTMSNAFTITPTQTAPANSIGGHVSANDIYTTADIQESINSTQTTIPIATGTALPSSVGLASVGPEIFRYSGTNTSNNSLIQATRGIAPSASFPAGFDSFKIPEKVYYLNDLTSLFDTRPAIGLSHYRCIAITNSDTSDDFNIQDAFIGIAQNISSDVQIRIGVEFPKFDARTGVSDGNTTTSVLFDTSFTDVDSFFDGALIKFLSPTEWAVVDSYVANGQFILDRTVTGLTTGRSFVIMPAPSQIISNDATAPTSNNGLFAGFAEDQNGIKISLTEHGSTMEEHDLFYVWLRRDLLINSEATDDTGCVLIFRFRDI